MSKTIGTNKKILYLMEYPIDLPGGGQMSTQTLCEGITAYGNGDDSVYKFDKIDKDIRFIPVCACPSLLKKTKEDYPFEIITYPSDENRELSKLSRIKNFVSRIGWFYKIISSVKPDIIHVSMSESLITYGFLRCLGFFSRIPFIYTDRGLCYGYRKHSKLCIKATMKRASRMLTTTVFNKNLWEQEGIASDITVIPNTISSAFDYYDETARENMRQQYGVLEDDLVIGFAGRISEEKDWPSVKNIMRAIADAGIKCKVALVLSTYENRDAMIVEEVKQGIINAIGEDNLIYMQDLSQKEISDYYYMVDIFLMTSCFESFGKAAVEAMSRRCIVLSTAVGGLPEVIGHEEDLYSKDQLEVLVERIKTLTSDVDMMNAERDYFYNRYKSEYTKEMNITRHIAVYREVLK